MFTSRIQVSLISLKSPMIPSGTQQRTYVAIDLKSFYASVECAERRLDPLTTHLVVADASRTEKTICLAVTPSLKAYGIPGRARLFEVVQAVRDINERRRAALPYRRFTGASVNAIELADNPGLEVAYVVAKPRMGRYMQVSSQIYGIYLKYIAPEDIHIYSIDEVFIDATKYLPLYHLTARELTMRLIREVLQTTGITATAGIAPNLYLCKIAMDIVAKHLPADKDGVRIGELNEMSYRQQLWSHRPLTDFWRIGAGIAGRLEAHGMTTMGDVARMSVANEELLYRLFGVNAELLIDHAWGAEECTIADIKAYRPAANSLSSGQVLQNPYDFEKARVVVKEMADQLVLDLVEKRLVTNCVGVVVGYDVENLTDDHRRAGYHGEVRIDHYGRPVPKEAHGSCRLDGYSSSTEVIVQTIERLFNQIVSPELSVRRLTVVAENVLPEESPSASKPKLWQPDLFTDTAELEQLQVQKKERQDREKRRQHALIDIRQRLGKNAILKGLNLDDGATAKERNMQVGGHHV